MKATIEKLVAAAIAAKNHCTNEYGIPDSPELDRQLAEAIEAGERCLHPPLVISADDHPSCAHDPDHGTQRAEPASAMERIAQPPRLLLIPAADDVEPAAVASGRFMFLVQGERHLFMLCPRCQRHQVRVDISRHRHELTRDVEQRWWLEVTDRFDVTCIRQPRATDVLYRMDRNIIVPSPHPDPEAVDPARGSRDRV